MAQARKTAMKFFELQADVLITGNGLGGHAATVLDKGEVKIYVGRDSLLFRKLSKHIKIANWKNIDHDNSSWQYYQTVHYDNRICFCNDAGYRIHQCTNKRVMV